LSQASLLPRAALTIAVTGHRAPVVGTELAPRIRDTIAELLGELERLRAGVENENGSDFQPGGGLEIVTMLASGSDMAAANAALASRIGLQAILPLPRRRYVKDFKGADEEHEFERLLAAADAVTELPDDDDAPAAYRRGGEILVACCDILIAVWDGEESRGRGGTGEVVQKALDAGRPVFVIAPGRPEASELVWPSYLRKKLEPLQAIGASRLKARTHLPDVVREILMPPHDEDTKKDRELFDSGKAPGRARIEYPLLLAVLGIERSRRAAPEPNLCWAGIESEMSAAGRAAQSIWQRFRRADQLGDYYGAAWRGSFVFRNLLGAMLAFGAGLGAFLSPQWRTVLTAVSLLFNCLVLLDLYLSRRKRWHERWLRFRFLAENLRWLRIHRLAGLPAETQPQDQSEDWVEWYARRTARALGIRSLRYDKETVRQIRETLIRDEVLDQATYHRNTAIKAATIDKRLNGISRACFAAAAAAALVFLTALGLSLMLPEWLSAGIPIALTVLPAFGMAIVAVRGRADQGRLAARSQELSQELDRLKTMLEAEDLTFDRLREALRRTRLLFAGEAREWKEAAEHRQPLAWRPPEQRPS
jgi:hypothetical protein